MHNRRSVISCICTSTCDLGLILLLSLCVVLCDGSLQGQVFDNQKTSTKLDDEFAIIPDGTPIHLRFAQPVCGAAPGLKAIAAKKGVVVPLVVSRDLRMNDKVVIAKGALAEATVERVLPAKHSDRRHRFDPVFPGISLQLNWVTTVTGKRATIRPQKKGPAKAMDPLVQLRDGGADVRPEPISNGMFGFLWRAQSAMQGPQSLMQFPVNSLLTGKLQDSCIPNRSRMSAYLDGDLTFRMADLNEAQAALPAPNADATFYVFRLKEKKKEADVAPPLVCGRIEFGSLGPQQMAIVNVPPGNYSCRIGQQPPIQTGVDGGREYYWQMHRGRHNKWELWWWEEQEVGEDLSAEAEVVPAKATASSHQ